MKKLFFSLSLLASFASINAQSVQAVETAAKVDSTLLKNWMHSDFQATGIYGVNTLKAKAFLAEHNRKPQNIVVGVLDSGVEYFHEDLKNIMWVNPKEKADDKKDNDKNGYIDDIHGWNFVTDKDGKSYAEDTLELTRQYSKYAKKFERNEAAKVKDPEGYKRYLELKKDYFSTITRYKMTKEVANARMSYVKPRLDALNKAFAGETLTKKKVDSFVSEDPLALEALFVFSEVPQKDWENKTIEEITASYEKKISGMLASADNNMKYNYNLSFNPQEGLGKTYGNNDVKGLSDFHGTHVSGIIAAEWDNGKGMMGTGGGNYVKIMGVRTVPDGDERDQDVANGIRYAVNNGAKILNMSFGKLVDDNSPLVKEAFKYAESKNVLIVKAAGNNNLNVDETTLYPITLVDGKQYSPTTITVGANTRNADNLRARFSNFGKAAVDVFGPGTEIYSTIPGTSKYGFAQGTSMASPAVAGVAALVWSHYPKLTAKDIKQILVETVNKNDQLKDISVSGGVVDSYKAVQKAEEIYKQRKLK
ncbi:S8 family serine peptidase [Chryseobacterium sp. POL2]|uniref:S8 family serine peptidase n=1 Tax=Chryseobacterium sp. POL2 TaxID=2713414 RepID=UPI0013E1EF6D|nr:S8 family serine peptidase [Chryseobacterium sp. POL2]QIG88858.1 S8 family serine peptidase [Chryseobacterium sp. POL2]